MWGRVSSRPCRLSTNTNRGSRWLRVVPVSTPAEAQSGQVAGIYYKDDLIAAPMRFVDGAIELPVGAGMGIAADEAKVRRYGVGGKG